MTGWQDKRELKEFSMDLAEFSINSNLHNKQIVYFIINVKIFGIDYFSI